MKTKVLCDSRGFALPLLLALLPLAISVLLASYASVAFIQSDLALKHVCRREGLEGQKAVAPLLTKLLSLNSEAVRLRTLLTAAEAAERAAVKAAQWWALPGLRATIKRIKGARQKLESQQKQLIRQSNQYLESASRKGRQGLQGSPIKSNAFFEIKIQPGYEVAPRLAVRPVYSDTAPPYRTLENFDERQALVQRWQYQIMFRRPFSNFLPASFNFEKRCAVSLRKELSQWHPQIIKGKSSLKSVW